MFSVDINKLGLQRKLDYFVFKSYFFNRLIIKGYRKSKFNFFFNAGDILSLNIVRLEKKVKSLQLRPTSQRVVGRVLAKYNKGIHSYFILRNVYSGVPVEFTFPLFSPMILSIKLLQTFRRIVFRSKVYFYRDLPNPRNKIKFKFLNKPLKYSRYKQRKIRNLNFNYNSSILYRTLSHLFTR